MAAQCLVDNGFNKPDDLLGAKAGDLSWKEGVSAGHRALVRRALDLVNKAAKQEGDRNACAAGGSASVAEPISKLVSLLTPPVEATVHIDVAAVLPSVCLDELQAELWPDAAAVDALATDGKKLAKTGVARPFVHADLR